MNRTDRLTWRELKERIADLELRCGLCLDDYEVQGMKGHFWLDNYHGARIIRRDKGK